MDKNLYIGIDPGIEGALAVLDCKRNVYVCDMPTLTVRVGNANHNYVDHIELKRKLVHTVIQAHELGYTPVAVLEDVHATPQVIKGFKKIGKGTVAQFSLGNSKGQLEMALAFLEVQMFRVSPEKWKKAMGLLGREKDASIKLAKEMFPAAAYELRHKTKDGRAEALLLAAFQANIRPALI